MKRHDVAPRPYEVASALGSYALISSAMVVLNKIVFTHLGSKVPYPTFVTWFQMLVTLVFCLLADATVARPENKLIRPIAMSTSIARDLVPLSLAYCGTIVLNNLSLSYVELAFYPVIRSTSIIFTIVLNNCMLPQKIPLMVILSCVVIIAGLVLTVIGEVRFSWQGTLYGLASSFVAAIYGILTKQKLHCVGSSEWRLSACNSMLAVPLLVVPVLLMGEFEGIAAHEISSSLLFWALLSVTGLCGGLINISTFLAIKLTSPLSFLITGISKNALLTVLSTVWLGTPWNLTYATGIAVNLLGCLWYSILKMQPAPLVVTVPPVSRSKPGWSRSTSPVTARSASGPKALQQVGEKVATTSPATSRARARPKSPRPKSPAAKARFKKPS